MPSQSMPNGLTSLTPMLELLKNLVSLVFGLTHISSTDEPKLEQGFGLCTNAVICDCIAVSGTSVNYPFTKLLCL